MDSLKFDSDDLGVTEDFLSRAYARIGAPGRYAITVTRPHLYRDYLIEQLSLLSQDFDVEIEVGRSNQEIGADFTQGEIQGESGSVRAITIGVRYDF